MNKKYVVVIYVGGTKNGKQYNNFQTGEPLLFSDEETAERFAREIEEGSSSLAWATVEEYDVYKEKPMLFE